MKKKLEEIGFILINKHKLYSIYEKKYNNFQLSIMITNKKIVAKVNKNEIIIEMPITNIAWLIKFDNLNR